VVVCWVWVVVVSWFGNSGDGCDAHPVMIRVVLSNVMIAILVMVFVR